jgi:alginate O-acetyltransferase complex protein AlgI
LATFHLLFFGWIFFRANSLHDAFSLFQRLVSTPWDLHELIELAHDVPAGMLEITALLVALFIILDPIMDAYISRQRTEPRGLRGMTIYASLLVAILIFGYFGGTSFIYFQF